MKALKIIVRSAVCICLLLNLVAASAQSSSPSVDSLQWGGQLDGLQMSISTNGSGKAEVPEFQIAFRNAGEYPVALNLGTMLANGTVKLPERISLNLTDAGGQTRKLKFSDKKYPFVAGRADDYIVEIPAGSIYTFKVNLDQFWSPSTKEFELELTPGNNQVIALFEGTGPTKFSTGMPELKFLKFWKGELQSNALTVEK